MKKIFYTLTLIALFFMIKDGFTNDNGIAIKTNAPGEQNCTTGCHNSFTLNTGGGSVVISCPTMPNWEYVAGTTYPISVTVAKTGVNTYGFDFEASLASGANAGTLQVTSSTEMKTLNGNVGGNLRTTMTHKAVGTGTGSKTFNFNWIAPATSVGTITFYAAGVCANNNGNNKGDYVYTTNQAITPLNTGIAAVSGEIKDLSVFPNPATDYVNVHFANKSNQAVKVELYDMNGRFEELLLNNTETSGIKMFRFNFNEKYATGLYLLKVSAGDEVSYRKIYIGSN